MKTTTDTYTGKRFRYNMVVSVIPSVISEQHALHGRRTVNTVGRMTSRTFDYLHPDRLTPAMFARLNPEEEK